MTKLKRTLLAAASTSLALGLMSASAMAATVTVQPGDSLWKIANTQHISLQALETSNPGVNPQNLTVGTTLQFPQSQAQGTYQVQSGDSLFLVARKFGISVASLQAANPSVDAANLTVGEVLQIPSGSGTTAAWTGVSSSDLYWMARVINAEAGNQSLDAKIAVGDVVWHRELSSSYPNTVQGVVFQVSNGHYQFTSASNGIVYQTPSAQSVQAAKDVLEQHIDLVPGAYVFYTPSKTPASSWVRKQPYIKSYGQMTFSV
jgi:cell wall hydrolase